MSKKLFVAVTGTLLTSLFTTLVVVGCSSSDSTGGGEQTDGGQEDVKTTDATPDRKPPTEVDGAVPPEEGTVGNLCSTNTDCEVEGSAGDNICSKGAVQGNDLFGTPVCIQPACTIGSGSTIDDITCDNQKGLCVPTGSGSSGVCFPFCTFDSTKVESICQGGNKCSGAYISNGQSGGALGLGFCAPACTADADCKGTAGQKCQVETGECLLAANHVDMTAKFAKACDPTATTATCACAPSAADTKKGICGSACVTGTAGNTACAAAGGNENWKCTAHLKSSYTGNGGSTITGYTAQPDDIVGNCALACPNGDGDCADLSTEAGTPMTCQEFVGGNFCAFPAK